MAKARKNVSERKGSMIMLRLIMEKLQRTLFLYRRPPLEEEKEWDEGVKGMNHVPKDVKEGHFVVFAVEGERPKRFVVELGCLANPEFLKLLKQAAEEFGFKQEGALCIPCRPDDLQRILGGSRKDDNGGGTAGAAGGDCGRNSHKTTTIRSS